jgi:excisionase family DNA binding protein
MSFLQVPFPDEMLEEIVRRSVERFRAEVANRGDESWPEWMGVPRAARYLDVSEERLRKQIARRQVPYYQEAPGCRISLRRSELDEWMQNFRHDVRGGGV